MSKRGKRRGCSGLPLLDKRSRRASSPSATGAWSRARFPGPGAGVAAQLPRPAAVNLCEDRYHFLVAFCAVVWPGRPICCRVARAPSGRRGDGRVSGLLRAGRRARRRRRASWPPPLPAVNAASACRRCRRAGRRDRLHLRLHRPAQTQPEDLGQLLRQHRAQRGAAARPAAPQYRRHGAAAAHVWHGDVGAAAALGGAASTIASHSFRPTLRTPCAKSARRGCW